MPPNLGKDWEVVETGKKPHVHKLPKPGNPGVALGTVIMCRGCQVCYKLIDDQFSGRGWWTRVNRVENGWR